MMSDRLTDPLESLLQRRAYRPPSEDFTTRILAAAARTPQREPVTLRLLLHRLCAEFHLPRPAYAFASVLVLGLALGLTLAPADTSPVPVTGPTLTADAGAVVPGSSGHGAYVRNLLLTDEVVL